MEIVLAILSAWFIIRVLTVVEVILATIWAQYQIEKAKKK